jgi:hypothetical protein
VTAPEAASDTGAPGHTAVGLAVAFIVGVGLTTIFIDAAPVQNPFEPTTEKPVLEGGETEIVVVVNPVLHV